MLAHAVQQVCIARGMFAIRLPIRHPAVIYQRRHVAGQDAVRIDGEYATAGAHPTPTKCFPRHRIQPLQAPGLTQARFVGMRHGNGYQRLRNRFNVRAQPRACLPEPNEHHGRIELLADIHELSARLGARGHAQRTALLRQPIAGVRFARIVPVLG